MRSDFPGKLQTGRDESIGYESTDRTKMPNKLSVSNSTTEWVLGKYGWEEQVDMNLHGLSNEESKKSSPGYINLYSYPNDAVKTVEEE